MDSSYGDDSDIYDPQGQGDGESLADYDPELLKELYEQMQAEYSVYDECIKPTVSQGIQSIWILLLMCLLLRMFSLLKPPTKLIHIASFVAGCFVLWHFYGQSMMHVLLPCAVGYILLKFKATCNGTFLSLISVIYLLSCEKLLIDGQLWNKIRGSVMIVVMKLIHVGFDTTNGIIPSPLSLIEYYGYILNPASIIFGPFITYADYNQLLQAHKMSFLWIAHTLRAIGLSIICLLWSTCGISNVFTMLGENRWIVAYGEANSFRFSHYFVSYVSESSCLIMGIGSHLKIRPSTKTFSANEKSNQDEINKNYSTSIGDNQDNKSEKNADNEETFEDAYPEEVSCKLKESTRKSEANDCEVVEQFIWKRPVANVLTVEIPRSLVEVVTNWNLPMHFWLKNYVFKPSRYLGIFPAILLTYIGSSMLHGLNFQLSAVLLSIGTFAYIENAFRNTLAATFDACIGARRCLTGCKHTYKENNFWVMAGNLSFGFIAVWNLAYLGCLFDGNPEGEEKGYSMRHALKKWENLNNASHWFMLGMFIFQKLSRDGQIFSLPTWVRYPLRR